MCTKFVLDWGKFDSASQALRTLHWLLVKSRIVFKLLLITFKCINNQAPDYIRNLLVRPPSECLLRSTSGDLCLIVPFTKRKTFVERAFSVSASRMWNYHMALEAFKM